MGCLREEWEGRIPKAYWRGYEPDSVALAINQERIALRLDESKAKRLAGDKAR